MKKTFRFAVAFLCLCSCWLAGCSSEKDETPVEPSKPTIELAVSESLTPTVGTEGGTTTLTFTASGSWTASVNAVTRAVDWVSVQPTSGEAGTVTLRITTQANDTYDERNAVIRLTCGTAQQTVTLTQKQRDALIVTSNKVEIDAVGGAFSVELQANVSVSYEIEESAKEWITAATKGTRGLTTSTLSFEAAENPDEAPRQATITLKGEGLTETVTVYQSGSEPTILLSQKEYMVSADGETIQVELKSNTAYEVVMPEVDWITEVSTRAFSAYTHYFTIAPNETYDARTAEITFINKENGLEEKVSITQMQKDALLIGSNRVEIGTQGGTFDIRLQANVDVSFEIDEAGKQWVKHISTETKGLTTSVLRFEAAENPDEAPRQATITLKGEGLTETVIVYQSGGMQPTLVLSQKEFNVASGGETIWVDVESNTNYKVVMPGVDWVTEVSTRSTIYSHCFEIAENTTYDERTAEILFVDEASGLEEKVTIIQTQKEAIVVEQSEYTVEAAGGKLEIPVEANVEYTVETYDYWISQISTRGLIRDNLCFEIAANEEVNRRAGTIAISSLDGTIVLYIAVVQAARPFYMTLLSAPTEELSAEEQTFVIKVEANVDWLNVDVEEEWIRNESSDKRGNIFTFEFRIDKNRSTARTSDIVFTGNEPGGEELRVTISQKSGINIDTGFDDLPTEEW